MLSKRSFRLTAGLFIASGFLLHFLAVFPGLMTWDSFAMWNMGVEWRFWDWHHPFIGVLMGLGRLLRDDPAPYLFVQLGLNWGGAFVFILALERQIGSWALLGALLCLLPSHLSHSGYLHTTPLLTACYFFVCSWLYLVYIQRDRLGPVQFSGLAFLLFLGTVLRVYAYAAAFPIILFLSWMFLKSRNVRRIKFGSLVLTAALICLYIALNHLLVYQVLKAEKFYKTQAVYLFDLAAIYALTGKLYAAEFVKDDLLDQAAALEMYNREATGLWRIMKMYRIAKDQSGLHQIQHEWWRAVSENFPVYVQHKLHSLGKCLGITAKKISVYKLFGANSRLNTDKLEKLDTIFWRLFKRYMGSVQDMFFMKPWFWALLNLLFSLFGLVLMCRPRYRAQVWPHCLMLWSGLLFLGPYVLLCLSADARFTYWITVATSFGGFGLLSVSCKEWKEISVNSNSC